MTQEHESPEDKKSRLLLITFLQLSESLLERVTGQLIFNSKRLLNAVTENLRILMRGAHTAVRSTIESLKIGLNRRVRESLEKAGMFGSQLKAKFALLSFDINGGAVLRVLKRLNSMLGSFAKVFDRLEIVKEYKEHVEITIESLKDAPKFISLKDLLKKNG